MELLIIRHAQSTNNTLVDQGERVVDPPLTGLGLQQAELVAKHLANGHDHETPPIGGLPVDSATNGMRIKRLYCSAMLRALQTATAIGHVLELQPQVWVDVHEEGGMWLDHGDGEGIQGYPGLTRSEIAAQFPQVILPAEVTASGWWRHGREEWTSFQERANRVADALRKDGQRPRLHRHRHPRRFQHISAARARRCSGCRPGILPPRQHRNHARPFPRRRPREHSLSEPCGALAAGDDHLMPERRLR